MQSPWCQTLHEKDRDHFSCRRKGESTKGKNDTAQSISVNISGTIGHDCPIWNSDRAWKSFFLPWEMSPSFPSKTGFYGKIILNYLWRCSHCLKTRQHQVIFLLPWHVSPSCQAKTLFGQVVAVTFSGACSCLTRAISTKWLSIYTSRVAQTTRWSPTTQDYNKIMKNAMSMYQRAVENACSPGLAKNRLSGCPLLLENARGASKEVE